MDLEFLGLSRLPFESTPNPRQYVNLAPYRHAIETLLTAVKQRKGIVVITGAPGTGKTLVTRVVRQRLGAQAAVATLARPCVNVQELCYAIADGFRITPRTSKYATNPIPEIEQFLENLYQQDVPAVLLVENAHELTDDCIEMVRRIAALEADDMPLLQVVLVGWPRLVTRFLGYAGSATQQRVYRHIQLGPLSESDTIAYVRGRVRLAGGPEDGLFADDALRTIHRRTGGVPRLINWLGDALLTQASADRTRLVDAARAEAIPFAVHFDPHEFEAQTEADAIGEVVDGAHVRHPLLRDVLDRMEQLEAFATQQAIEIEQLQTQQGLANRQLARYERAFQRMLPAMRGLRQYRQKAEAALAECAQGTQQLADLLKQPASVLHEARKLCDEMQSLCGTSREAYGELQRRQADLQAQIAACERAAGNCIQQMATIEPTVSRTNRLVGVLRRVHNATFERSQTLEALTQRAQRLCDVIPQRLSAIEQAVVKPEQTLERLRLANKFLQKQIEVGEEQGRSVKRMIEQAAATARALRESIDQARTTERPAAAPQRFEASLRTAEPTHSSLAQRVQRLRDLVQDLRGTPTDAAPTPAATPA